MIQEWLGEFLSAWENKDIPKVMDLFSNDVEYWETPFEKLKSKDDLAKAWEAIKRQEQLVAKADVFMQQHEKYAIRWRIKYIKDEQLSEWSGVYLLKLNEKGICNYFCQVGEKK